MSIKRKVTTTFKDHPGKGRRVETEIEFDPPMRETDTESPAQKLALRVLGFLESVGTLQSKEVTLETES